MVGNPVKRKGMHAAELLYCVVLRFVRLLLCPHSLLTIIVCQLYVLHFISLARLSPLFASTCNHHPLTTFPGQETP